MKRTLAAALLASGALVSAQSFADASGPSIVHYGDENELSWLYTPASAPATFSEKPRAEKTLVHFGDENDVSWIYAPRAAQSR